MNFYKFFNNLPKTAQNTIVSVIVFLILWPIITGVLVLISFETTTAVIIALGAAIIMSGRGWLRIVKRA